ncbi:protein arginine N-methyltransferase 7-like isoform X2 [Cimex lectularius]|nr:protein arginine N-methyltransferase 7-like isoform X2 [Cimex lectularius]XP_014248299.1 protein arginine N-methyltransferase 7-like isoform X2 [Cimex lectularius]XP_014248300.1 protein arginine N-methyltransferase 7-like isoform X2 [Cimex lectularius]
MKVEGGNTFVQKINPLTGYIGWQLMDENYDYHQEIACSMYADMLHDTDRNKKYYAALKKAIEKKHSMGQKANILDIGTGTGLLSMMAANCKADSIVACEAFLPIAKVARRVIEDNCLSYNIKVVHKRSTELKVGPGLDMEFRANILITEVFDTELIGEGAVDTFNHANEHLLEKDAIIVPWTSKLYAVALQSELLASCNRIPEFVPLDPDPIKIPRNIVSCTGTAGVHDLQLSQVPKNEIKIMSEPVHVFNFDFYKKIEHNRLQEVDFKCVQDGRIDSIGMYWTLDMDQEGETVISCAPSFIEETPWRDHWMQAVYHLPTSVEVAKGEQVKLYAQHDQFSHAFHIQKDCMKKPDLSWPACNCRLHMRTSRTRLYWMNDKLKWKKYVNVLRKLPTGKTILYLGDISLLPIAAAKLGAKKVISIQDNIFSFKVMKSIIESNGLTDVIELLDSYKANIGEVDYVVSEPYFTDSIFPWDGARCWYLSKRLAPNAKCLPSKLRIMGVPMQFDNLHKIKLPLGKVEGFRMDSFDRLIQNSSDRSCPDVDVQPLWEYPGVCLSKPKPLMEFDLNADSPESQILDSGEIEFTREGSCHGVALWADWDFGSEVISTGIDENEKWDIGTKQGVYFNRKPSSVTCGLKMDYEATLFPQMGCIHFKFDFPL